MLLNTNLFPLFCSVQTSWDFHHLLQASCRNFLAHPIAFNHSFSWESSTLPNLLQNLCLNIYHYLVYIPSSYYIKLKNAPCQISLSSNLFVPWRYFYDCISTPSPVISQIYHASSVSLIISHLAGNSTSHRSDNFQFSLLTICHNWILSAFHISSRLTLKTQRSIHCCSHVSNEKMGIFPKVTQLIYDGLGYEGSLCSRNYIYDDYPQRLGFISLWSFVHNLNCTSFCLPSDYWLFYIDLERHDHLKCIWDTAVWPYTPFWLSSTIFYWTYNLG